ncbi:MAG: hypothetical protein WCJ30_18745 [Deltaproteobacteria bacterium]
MRPRPAALALAAALPGASCSGATSHPVAASAAPTPIASSRPAFGVTPGEPVPFDVSIPADSWFRLALDPAALDAWLARVGPRIDPGLAHELTRMLGTDEAALRTGHLAATLGLDLGHPVQLAFAPLDAASAADVENLRALVAEGDAHPSDSARAAIVQAMSAPHPHTRFRLRASVPTAAPEPILRLLRHLLEQTGWRRFAGPQDVDDLYVTADTQGALSVSRWADTVVLDLFIMPFAVPSPQGPAAEFLAFARSLAAALRARPATRIDPVTTEGDILRAEFVPEALATANFAFAMAAVVNALASTEPSVHDSLATVGAHEAGQAFAVARNERGAFFDRIAVAIHGDPSLTLRADLGPGASVPDGDVWVPRRSVQHHGGATQLDVLTAFLAAWQLPGDPAPGSAADATGSFRRARLEAGGLSLFAAFPYALIDALRRNVDSAPEPFPALDASLRRFERFSVISPRAAHGPAQDVYVGLFAQNATASDAACVLSPAGSPCAPSVRLTLDRTLTRSGHAVRLTRVGDRFALLVCNSRGGLEALHLEPTTVEVPPAHFFIDLAAIDRNDPFTALLPGTFEGDIAREGRRLVFNVRPRP